MVEPDGNLKHDTVQKLELCPYTCLHQTAEDFVGEMFCNSSIGPDLLRGKSKPLAPAKG